MPPLVYGAITLQTLLAASTFLVAKGALAELRPLELTGLRFVLAASLFGVVLVASRRPLLPPRRHLARAMCLGLLGLPLHS